MFKQTTFYDKFWNFDNKKFLVLLEKAKKAKEKKSWWIQNKILKSIFLIVSQKKNYGNL